MWLTHTYAFTVLTIYTQAAYTNKKCNTQVSKSGSECVSVNLNHKIFLGGHVPGPLDMLGPLALA